MTMAADGQGLPVSLRHSNGIGSALETIQRRLLDSRMTTSGLSRTLAKV